MRLYLRNKMGGEIKEVEADSSEFRSLVKEVTPGGLPKWEQTSFPHAEAIQGRAKYGDLNEEDLGEEDKDDLRPAAVALALEGVAPEANPHLQLTPGEIEMGLTPRDKLRDLEEMYDRRRLGIHRQVFDRAADHISGGEREDRPGSTAESQSARAGGTDDRMNPPSTGGDSGGGDPDAGKVPASAGSSSPGSGSQQGQPAGKPGAQAGGSGS